MPRLPELQQGNKHNRKWQVEEADKLHVIRLQRYDKIGHKLQKYKLDHFLNRYSDQIYMDSPQTRLRKVFVLCFPVGLSNTDY